MRNALGGSLLGLWLCSLSLSSMALHLIDGNNYRYDINAEGALISGTLAAYNRMYRLRINSTTYTGTITDLISDGRESPHGHIYRSQ